VIAGSIHLKTFFLICATSLGQNIRWIAKITMVIMSQRIADGLRRKSKGTIHADNKLIGSKRRGETGAMAPLGMRDHSYFDEAQRLSSNNVGCANKSFIKMQISGRHRLLLMPDQSRNGTICVA
jgi:hypothetical protein